MHEYSENIQKTFNAPTERQESPHLKRKHNQRPTVHENLYHGGLSAHHAQVKTKVKAAQPTFTFGRDFATENRTSAEKSLTDVNFYPEVKGIAKRDPKSRSLRSAHRKDPHSVNPDKLYEWNSQNSCLTESEKYSKARERLFPDDTYIPDSQRASSSDNCSLKEENITHEENIDLYRRHNTYWIGDIQCDHVPAPHTGPAFHPHRSVHFS